MHPIAASTLLIGIITAVDSRGQSTGFTVTANEQNIFQNCMDKMGISQDEIAAVLDDHEKDASDKVKCYNGCLYKSFKVIKGDGMIDKEAAVKFFKVEDHELDKKIVIDCSNEANSNNGKNECDTAQAMEACYYEMKRKQ